MTFFIGDCEVFPDLNRIRRGEDILEVEPRVMAVLEELAREPGRVLTRDDLHRSVWSDVIVSDDALTRCIRELRRILGDDARAPKYIETISKRGYRLIAPVTSPVTSQEHVAVPAAEAHEVTILATTLLGHRAEVRSHGDAVTLQRENVTLTATPRGDRYHVRTRIFAAAIPLVFGVAAFFVTAMLLYGRPMQYSHGVGFSLLGAALGALAGLPARRRALDRSRAAIAAFARRTQE